MRSSELSSIVENIFRDYSPMKSIDQHFFNKKSDDVKKIFSDHTQKLSEIDKRRIEDEIFGWGPLEKIKERSDIFEIIVKGSNDIFFETAQGLERWNDHFLSDYSFYNFTEELFKKANILVSKQEPCANGFIDGFRIHVTTPPVTKEINITLRKHRKKTFPLSYYLESHFFDDDQFSYINKIIDEKKNFLVIGPTGSGKTTLLNSLIHSVAYDRCVIIEDTDEMQCPEGSSTKLLSREITPDNLKAIYIGDLVKQALRMRPDRIVIGEVRGPEAKDLLMALATGHSGSIGTLHAQSAQQAIYRLEMLIQMGAPQWNLMAIRRLILMSLDYLIVLKEDRYNKGIEGIYKICSLEDFGLLLNKDC